MKIAIFKTMAFVALSVTALSCSSNDDIMADVQPQTHSETSKEVSKTQTYKVRFGLISLDGTKTLSGNHDVGSFLAENTVTGEIYDTYYGGGFQTLPGYYDGIPAGTYTFSAMQGQGGWTGYGSVTGTVSDTQVDADGYITVYIPVTWAE
ncbi:hypothetical protein HHL23_04830 [Chryseobacterium sp. RP-3-3]|uniref:Carboxypeptidase regulatory-like domain-containing protein n=1 Tax=Chryseobacterium antibioticum TaxID=2728847 RepID=A0A7Y0AKR5_9FLAO|nr:hypothetical protein [Chryseobacterium antibioticum]NML69115.1 hypothetical protein [Chryseobacterium antibioticum]